MDETTARWHCLKNGSQLLSYADARAAFLILPSGEQVVISVGTASAKVGVRRPLLGWYLPRVVASEQLSKWDDQYTQRNALQRCAVRANFLDGLLSLISGFKSTAELRLAWCVIRNPIEVAVLHQFYGLRGDAGE